MSGLFLDDGDPLPPRRTRPRWLDALGLTVVVAGMVAIGVLGDRGSKDDPAPTTTTSSSTTTTTTVQVPPPTSTTTTTVRFDPVPGAHTRLLLLRGRSSIPVVVDVDAGSSQLAGAAALQGSGIGTTAGVLSLHDGELSLTRLADDLHTASTSGRALGPREWGLTPVGRDGAWVTAQEGVDVVTGLVGPDGADTGKPLRLRPGAFVVAGFDDGVVTAQAGSLTWVPVSGTPRSLGTGGVFGYGDHRIVRNSCQLLRCRLEVLDVRSGATRRVSGVPEVQPEARPIGGSAVGSDGTWVATSGFHATDGYALLFTVDLETGEGRVLQKGSDGHLATAIDGPWVFLVSNISHDLRAYDHRTGESRTLRTIDDSDVADLVAVPFLH